MKQSCKIYIFLNRSPKPLSEPERDVYMKLIPEPIKEFIQESKHFMPPQASQLLPFMHVHVEHFKDIISRKPYRVSVSMFSSGSANERVMPLFCDDQIGETYEECFNYVFKRIMMNMLSSGWEKNYQFIKSNPDIFQLLQ